MNTIQIRDVAEPLQTKTLSLPALKTVGTQLHGWDREPDIEGIERERTATSLVLTVR